MQKIKKFYKWFMKVSFFNKMPEILWLIIACCIGGILYYHGPQEYELVFLYIYEGSFWAMFVAGGIRIAIVWYNWITNKNGQRK